MFRTSIAVLAAGDDGLVWAIGGMRPASRQKIVERIDEAESRYRQAAMTLADVRARLEDALNGRLRLLVEDRDEASLARLEDVLLAARG